jgi:exo-beta-1,3-glucanase (GH17 family)
MTYSPYTSTGGCKSFSAVAADIASIASKGFTSVRLYSTDCSGLQKVGTATASHGLRLVLGVFISETGISGAESQVGEITSWANGNYENVEMVVIGNEAVFNGYCTASALVSFLASARSTLKAAGYSGPVTTTEPINILQQYSSTLCPAMDVASANIHPFFNADVSASSAGEFVATELRMLATVCPGKETYNLETGWPNQGQANGAARPGVAEQKEAVESIKKVVGGKSVFFSFEDDLWKGEGALGVERSWGCGHLFGD